MKEYPLIELPGLDAIEAEKGEVLVNPNQVTFAINGKTHAKGGTKMLAEAGSYILSDHLKLDADVVDTLIGVKKKMSPAKLSKMYDTQKWADIMESNDKRYDELAKTTAAMMFAKNSARQGMIYQAQEQLKAKRGMKNDLENAMSKSTFQTGGKVKYQDAGETPNEYWAGPMSAEWYERTPRGGYSFGNNVNGERYDALGRPIPIISGNMDTLAVQANALPPASKPFSFNPVNGKAFTVNTRTIGYSTREDGIKTSHYLPLAGDRYWDVRDQTLGKNGSQLSPETAKILGDWQLRISNVRSEFPGAIGKQIEEYIGKALREADKVSADKYLQKFVVMPDGSEILLANATDAQIGASKNLRYLNTKTGKADLVDLRDYENQNINPEFQTSSVDKQDLTNLPTTRSGIAPVAPVAPVAQNAPLPDTRKVPVPDVPGEVQKGVDWQSIINGTQIGLLATDLAATRTKPPYYDYASSEIAYTRFEPINTKQQERAFSIARQSIENSNLPQQVKQAQLSNMYGTMAEGVNQVDITNYQNKLTNDNRNIQTFSQVRNTDIQRQQDSNMRYVQEADRRNYMASAQRQEYLSNIMDTWSKHVSNRRDVGLVNQVSPQYDYNFKTEQVEYTPGVKANPNRLTGYGTPQSTQSTVPLEYLTAAGRKALGY